MCNINISSDKQYTVCLHFTIPSIVKLFRFEFNAGFTINKGYSDGGTGKSPSRTVIDGMACRKSGLRIPQALKVESGPSHVSFVWMWASKHGFLERGLLILQQSNQSPALAPQVNMDTHRPHGAIAEDCARPTAQSPNASNRLQSYLSIWAKACDIKNVPATLVFLTCGLPSMKRMVKRCPRFSRLFLTCKVEVENSKRLFSTELITFLYPAILKNIPASTP